MSDDLTADELEALDLMSRPVRLILKRAWGKTVQRPLWLDGPNMRKAAVSAELLTLIERVRPDAVALTPLGFRLALHLRRSGWPNCERPGRS